MPVFAELTSLSLLSVSSNQIHSIGPEILSGSDKLQELYLGNNNLPAVLQSGQHIFRRFPYLRKLHLHTNQIFNITPGVFSDLNLLEELHIGSNRISTLAPGTFAGLDALTNLFVDQNKLTTISSGVFQGLHTVENLQLNHNSIQTIDTDAFTGLKSLRSLWLHGNRLTSLSSLTFSKLPRPLQLRLSDPSSETDLPWNCSSLCWIKMEETRGIITWYSAGSEPQCGGGTPWDTFPCPFSGEKLWTPDEGDHSDVVHLRATITVTICYTSCLSQ